MTLKPGDWIPHPGPQDEFCSRGEFEVLFGGAAGPGKTDCLVSLATADVDKPDYRALLLRRTFPRLEEIMDRAWVLYPSMGGEWKATEKRWYFPGGDAARGHKPFVQMGHMQHEDSKFDYQGKQFDFAGFDELTQFTETQYLYITGSRVRNVNPHIQPMVRATTNPGGEGHVWVKNRFVDVASPGATHIDPDTGLSRAYIPATLYDNPTLTENDPGYISRLQMLSKLEQRRLIHGDWEVFSGQVFRELSQRTHGCEPFDIPLEWERFMSFDWGYSHPFSVGWYAVDYDKNLYRYREWYGCVEGEPDTGLRMVAHDVANQILDIEQQHGEKITTRVCDPSIKGSLAKLRRGESVSGSILGDFNNAGVFFMQGANDRIQGLHQCHERLRLVADVDQSTGELLGEDPRFKCFNTCEDWWRTVPLLQADPKKDEDLNTDMEDHAYDEWRYACMFRPLAPQKVERIPSGSMLAERTRLKRARAYARRHGVTLDSAYRKVR